MGGGVSNGAVNPILALRDHLAAHLADLDEEHAKAVKRVLELNEQRALARTLQDVVPVLPEKVEEPPPRGKVKHQDTTGEGA